GVIIQLEPAAEQICTQATEYDVCVSDGKFRTAALISNGARFGPCTMWSHPQAATGVFPRNRPAAGTDGVYIYAGKTKRHGVNLTSGCFIRFASANQRNIRAGAADIEADHLT